MYSGKPISKDKYAARHKAERPASDYAKVPRELDQYIVDPTTKKRYLRGRFLGKVRCLKCKRHLNLNPTSTASNRIFVAKSFVEDCIIFERLGRFCKMLRTYGHGDQRDFRRQDHLENHVNETAPKRKGKDSILLLKRERKKKCLNSSSFIYIGIVL